MASVIPKLKSQQLPLCLTSELHPLLSRRYIRKLSSMTDLHRRDVSVLVLVGDAQYYFFLC